MADEKRIGAYIGRGLQHVVYEYDDGWVIKVPRLWMRLSTTFMRKKAELTLVRMYFGNAVPETRVECLLKEARTATSSDASRVSSRSPSRTFHRTERSLMHSSSGTTSS